VVQPVYKQRIGEYASTTIDLLLETVFSIRSMQSGYKEENLGNPYPRVEAGSNTSTVALRVEGGNEKGSLKYETGKYGPSPMGL
jgi:hypothetical protein